MKRDYEMETLRRRNYIHDSHIHALRIAQNLTSNPALRNVFQDLEEKLSLIKGLRIVERRQ